MLFGTWPIHSIGLRSPLPPPREPPRCPVPCTTPTACACRSSSTARPTANSRPFRSNRCTTTRDALALEAATRQRAPPRPIAPRLPRLAVRCGVDAARDEHRVPRRLQARRPLRRAAGSGARTRRGARSALDGNEFIFDVQGHFVNPTGAWTRDLPARRAAAAASSAPKAARAADEPGLALSALHRPRRVHQGHLPRLRHRPHRAVASCRPRARASR